VLSESGGDIQSVFLKSLSMAPPADNTERIKSLRHTNSDPTHIKFKEDFDDNSPLAEALLAHAKLKRMNASRYKRKKKKGEITQEHEQYNITYCMMVGIRFSVSRQSVKLNKSIGEKTLLHVNDFMHTDSLTFDPQGSSSTPPHRLGYSFKFKDYSPEIFRRLRKCYGINDMDYMIALCGSFNFIEFISNSKSGQFFFYSNDGTYLIKTQSKAESKFLRQILPRYYMYMINNKSSLIVPFCGLHRVKLPHIRKKLHFVIMRSVYSNASSKKIHAVYDLKGSTQGRIVKPGEQVFKDLDLVRNNVKLHLGPRRNEFLKQLEEDSHFLRSMHIMDYSLLVGVHNKLALPVAKSITRMTGESSRTLAAISNNVRVKSPKSANLCLSPYIMPPKIDFLSSKTESDRPRLDSRTRRQKSKSVSEVTEIHEILGELTSRRNSVSTWTSYSCDLRTDDYLQSTWASFSHEVQTGYVSEEEEESDPRTRQHSKYAPIVAMDTEGDVLGEVYYFGIIDILQQFDAKKRTEFVFKLIKESDRNFSSVSPSKYAKRFLQFVSKNTD